MSRFPAAIAIASLSVTGRVRTRRFGVSGFLQIENFRAIHFVFGHLLSRRLVVWTKPFPDTVNL